VKCRDTHEALAAAQRFAHKHRHMLQLDVVQLSPASVKGWTNHVRYGNTVGLRKAVLRGPIAVQKRIQTSADAGCPATAEVS
jgi:hypothetical protein